MDTNPYIYLIDWFYSTDYSIHLTKSNKGKNGDHDIRGSLVNDDGECFSAIGRDELDVLKTLKEMVEGNYKNSRG